MSLTQKAYKNFIAQFGGNGFQPTFREWQFQAMQQMWGAPHTSIVLGVPTGSGKTFAYMSMLVAKLQRNSGEKAVVFVSSTTLEAQLIKEHASTLLNNYYANTGKTFTIGCLQTKKGHYNIRHYNFSSGQFNTQGTIADERIWPDFLVVSYKNYSEKFTCYTTPLTLPEAYKNAVCDEAHHLLSRQHINEQLTRSNKFIIYSSATATLIPGDHLFRIGSTPAAAIAARALPPIVEVSIRAGVQVARPNLGTLRSHANSQGTRQIIELLTQLWVNIIRQGTNPLTGRPIVSSQTIVFCPTNKLAEKLAEKLNQHGQDIAAAYTCEQNKGEKTRIMADFKNDASSLSILCTFASGLLSEGLDLAKLCQLVDFIDCFQSNRHLEIARARQRWGRLLRGQGPVVVYHLDHGVPAQPQVTFADVIGVTNEEQKRWGEIYHWGAFNWTPERLRGKGYNIEQEKNYIDATQEITFGRNKTATILLTINPQLLSYHSKTKPKYVLTITHPTQDTVSSSSSSSSSTYSAPRVDSPPPSPTLFEAKSVLPSESESSSSSSSSNTSLEFELGPEEKTPTSAPTAHHNPHAFWNPQQCLNTNTDLATPPSYAPPPALQPKHHFLNLMMLQMTATGIPLDLLMNPFTFPFAMQQQRPNQQEQLLSPIAKSEQQPNASANKRSLELNSSEDEQPAAKRARLSESDTANDTLTFNFGN